jgi:dienelactone hydrolase
MDPTTLNRMLENRVKDLAGRKPARNRADHEERAKSEHEILLKSLGLYPPPPRTDLQASVTGVLQRDGYRVEKVAYFSRPGVRVTAHLYLPESDKKVPVVLCPHGHWTYKKTEPVVQAQAIGLALQGIAAMVVDSPGVSQDANDMNERVSMGPHDDPFLAMGCPVQGVYVWDLVRALDYLESRPEVDAGKIGISGTSGGGTATMYAFAVDKRLSCAAPMCAATSMEANPHNGCLCNHVPGVLELGDRADVLAMRAPAPILLIGATEDPEFPPQGHRATHEKLNAIYKMYGLEHLVRLELVESPHDMNRRMREAALAFFAEHLQGEGRRSYVPEKRPLTDGASNPYPANTEPPTSPELLVLGTYDRSTTSFRDLLVRAMNEPYPSPFMESDRLVRWGRFGRLKELKPSASLRIVDDVSTEEPDVIGLPTQAIDQRLCTYLGLSVPEFCAQVIHLLLPGGPEGWETVAIGGDVMTSMIASMKTLVSGPGTEAALEEVVAEGPVASMTAIHLQVFRPTIRIRTSHNFGSWKDVLKSGNPLLSMPLARYLAWPQVGVGQDQ